MTPVQEVPRGARRDAIEYGWFDYKAGGRQSKPRFNTSGPQHYFWMKGMDAAERDRNGCNVDRREVPGWR